MTGDRTDWVTEISRRLDRATTFERIGRVAQVTGLLIESDGPHVRLGDVCEIRSPRHGMSVLAEVVGFREHRVLLMPLGEMDGIHPGCEVCVGTQLNTVPQGVALLGRVLDGLGRPIDDRGPLETNESGPLRRQPPNPLRRARINASFSTGVKASASSPVPALANRRCSACSRVAARPT
jgi:flagellum-specific ATP synthase